MTPGALPSAHAGSPCAPANGGADLLHPKCGLPARCFGYLGHAADPKTWKPRYCLASVDTSRLPKAAQAILSNYRGTKVSGIPEADIPEVLVRLPGAAARLGKMPHQTGEPTFTATWCWTPRACRASPSSVSGPSHAGALVAPPPGLQESGPCHGSPVVAAVARCCRMSMPRMYQRSFTRRSV